MVYIILIGHKNLRELIYLWILLNKNNIKCNISYIEKDPSFIRNLDFEGIKIFIKPSVENNIHIIDIKNNIFLFEKPFNLKSIENIYKDIIDLI